MKKILKSIKNLDLSRYEEQLKQDGYITHLTPFDELSE